MPRILSVSYDDRLLQTRHMLLQGAGYEVNSCLGLGECLMHCGRGNFDILVIGHSIPYDHKQLIAAAFRRTCEAPIISLRRNAGEEVVYGADFHIEADPENLLNVLATITSDKELIHAEAEVR